MSLGILRVVSSSVQNLLEFSSFGAFQCKSSQESQDWGLSNANSPRNFQEFELFRASMPGNPQDLVFSAQESLVQVNVVWKHMIFARKSELEARYRYGNASLIPNKEFEMYVIGPRCVNHLRKSQCYDLMHRHRLL